MSARSTLAWVLATVALLAATANAGGRDFRGNVVEYAAIENGAGAARILFKVNAGMRDLENVAIWRATLKVPLAGDGSAEPLRIRVYPVGRDWNAGSVDWHSGWDRPGGDFEREMYARGEISPVRGGTQELEVDVTGLVKEIVEAGFPAYGFLVTVHPGDGEGLRLADVSRFGALTGAELEIRYRNLGDWARRRNRDRG